MRKLIRLLILIIVIGGIGYAGYTFYQSAMDKVVDQTLDSVTESEDVAPISDDDRTRVKEIISESVSPTDYKKLLDYYNNGDYEALENWAQDNLTQEQMDELMSIANGYSD